MKTILFRRILRLLRSQQGQSIVMVVISLSAILTLAVSAAEVGHVYYAYHQLVVSTQAAAMAGAQEMSQALQNTTTSAAYTAAVSSAVKQYSSVSGGLNATSFLQNDAIATQTEKCSTTMETKFNVACEVPPGGGAGYNVIAVTQTAKVPLWFGGLIGMPSMNLSATATASMSGSPGIFNLAVIMDTTGSMATVVRNDKDCTTTQISCAVQGLEGMLETMDPCAQETACTSGTQYVDDVGLFVFPAISANYSANSYSADYCGSSAKSVPYNFINVTPGTTTQNLGMETTTSNPNTNAGAYEIIPFNDTYKTSDATQTLSDSSALAQAVGYASSGCNGLSAPGGQGTYYAQVIYTAQAALEQQQSLNPTSQNVMIILSDGDATACALLANTAAGGCNTAANIVADNNPTCAKTGGSCLNGTGTSSTNPTGYQSPNYPSALGECGQAVQAAQLATQAGTAVYTIGFGSETSGCTTDKTYTIAAGNTYGGEAWPSGPYAGTPCNAIAAMASDSTKFFSDNSVGCPVIAPANANFTSLAQIFAAITQLLGRPRLIPNGTT
jgi:Putative Tad-like Flp pilus-assembly